MNVQAILSRKGTAVATVQPDATLAQATASLRDHGIGALVVSANGRTIDGILSERDVVRALAAHGGGPSDATWRRRCPPMSSCASLTTRSIS